MASQYPDQWFMQITFPVGPVGSINHWLRRVSSPKCLMLTPGMAGMECPDPCPGVSHSIFQR